MDTLQKIALTRLGILAVEKAEASAEQIAFMVAELSSVGVRIENVNSLDGGLLGSFREVISEVRELRGEKRNYAPLFSGFPEKLPSYDDAELRFFLAAARLNGNPAPSDTELRDALDFSAIGWWPASSVPQDVNKATYARFAQDNLPGDTLKQWLTLKVVTKDERDAALKAFMKDCFHANSSLRADVREDLEVLLKDFGAPDMDLSDVPFRETRTLLLKELWKKSPSSIKDTQATPDDLLRLFADLSGSDVSLGSPLTYPKLNRKERRAIVNTLENSDRLGELFKRRDLWLKLERGLHVGEFNAPKAQAAFRTLRREKRDKTSLPSRFEALMSARDFTAAASLLAKEAPTLLARNLRRILSLSGGAYQPILEALKSAEGRIPARVLVSARAQISDNGETYPRVAFRKDGSALQIKRDTGHLSVAAETQKATLQVLEEMLVKEYSKGNNWAGEVVWVAPELSQVLMPESLRASAQGVVQVERGSRLPLGDAKVLRVFTHWKDAEATSTDLDLSMLALGENFEVVDHVGWTHLSNGTMTHSGDLTSAPSGAEEFIDVTLAAAKAKTGWRYLVPTILRYAGSTFNELPEANAGWMLREECSSDRRTFDVATVVNAFDLKGKLRTSVPFLVDLKTDEVLYADIYLRGEAAATVQRDSASITALSELVNNRSRIKANVKEVALMMAAARGAKITEVREEATITFGLDSAASFNVLKPEALLGELN